jgi:DNA-binding MarR family transcriptional regulator
MTKPPKVTLSFLVSQLGAHAAQLFALALEPLGLKPQDAGLLRTLEANPGLTQIEISALFGVLPSRLVLLIDGLEAKGLVERRRDDADRRLIRLYPTAAGAAAARRVAALTLAMESELFRALPPDAQRALGATLQQVIDDQGLRAGIHPAFQQVTGARTKTSGA